MDTALWIILGLTGWSLGSLPLGLVVGRALRRADSPRSAEQGSSSIVLAA